MEPEKLIDHTYSVGLENNNSNENRHLWNTFKKKILIVSLNAMPIYPNISKHSLT